MSSTIIPNQHGQDRRRDRRHSGWRLHGRSFSGSSCCWNRRQHRAGAAIAKRDCQTETQRWRNRLETVIAEVFMLLEVASRHGRGRRPLVSSLTINLKRIPPQQIAPCATLWWPCRGGPSELDDPAAAQVQASDLVPLLEISSTADGTRKLPCLPISAKSSLQLSLPSPTRCSRPHIHPRSPKFPNDSASTASGALRMVRKGVDSLIRSGIIMSHLQGTTQ